MKLILEDYVAWRWWVIIYASLLYAVLLSLFQREESAYMLTGCVSTLFAAGCFCGEFGPTTGFRILRTLPLSERELGRTYWWAIVGCPGLTILGMTLPVCLLTWLFRGDHVPILVMLERSLPGCVLLGATFLGSFGIPMIVNRDGVWTQPKRRLCLLLKLTLWSVPFYFSKIFPVTSPQWELFLVLGALASWAGWANAECFTRLLADPLKSSGSTQNQVAKSFTVPKGCGGLPFLLQGIVNNAAFTSVIYGIIVFSISHSANMLFGWTHRPGQQGREDVRLLIVLSIMWSLFQTMPSAQVRFLRTLPISSLGLAAFWVLTTSIGVYLVWSAAAVFWAVFLPHEPFLNEQQAAILVACCTILVAISVPVQMYYNVPRQYLVPAAYVGFVFPEVAGSLEGLCTPSVSGAIAFCFILGSIVATRLLLERSDRPYLGGTFGGASITWTKEPK